MPLFYEKGQAGETPHSAEFLFYFYLTKKIRLDVSSESSARQRIQMKYQVLFSLKNNEKSICKCRLLQYIVGGAIVFLLELTSFEKGGQNKNGTVNSLERDVPICLKTSIMQSQKRDINGDTEKEICMKPAFKAYFAVIQVDQKLLATLTYFHNKVYSICFNTPKIIIFYGGLIKFPSGLPCCMLA